MQLLDLFGDRSQSGDTTTLTIPADWNSWQGRHGGLVAGLAVDVAAATWPAGAVKAVTGHFGRQSDEGRFEFTAVTRRAGRVVRLVDVAVVQGGTEVLSATVTLAAEPPDEAAQWFAAAAPASLPPDRCQNFEFDRRFLPVGAHLDIRPCGGAFPLTEAAHPWMLAWAGVVPEVEIGPGAAVLLCDLAPGVYPMLAAPVAGPTVEMTVHLCAELGSAPGAGPALASQRNSATSRNWSVDDTSLWDAAGRLIAQARQVRRIVGGITSGVGGNPAA